MRIGACLFLCFVFEVSNPRLASPASLTQQIARVDQAVFLTNASLVPLELSRLAANASDFPTTPTTPGFVYVWNSDFGTFERESESLGPAFVDRANTVGKGRFELGTSYVFLDLTQIYGQTFRGRIGTVQAVDAPSGRDEPIFADDLTIQSHVLSLSATYGVTDRWDGNMFMPLVLTTLQIEEHGGGRLARADDSKFGVGDILLRTKYRLLRGAWFDLATTLSLRLPSGSRDDFQGLGRTTVTPGLAISRFVGSHEVRAILGVEVDPEDVTRSRIRYGSGVTVQPWRRVALVCDILGNSGLVDEQVSRFFPVGEHAGDALGLGGIETQPKIGGEQVTSFLPRTDIVDLIAGLKLSVRDNAVAFVSFAVPVTSDGFRPDFAPSVGIDFGF